MFAFLYSPGQIYKPLLLKIEVVYKLEIDYYVNMLKERKKMIEFNVFR